MAGGADEDAPFALLTRPDERTRLAFLNAARQQSDLARIANQVPIALIDEVECGETLGQRVGVNRQIERAVAKFGRAALPGQADPAGQFLNVLMAIYRPVDEAGPTPAFQKAVEGLGPFRVPAGVVRVEGDYIGLVHLRGRGP